MNGSSKPRKGKRQRNKNAKLAVPHEWQRCRDSAEITAGQNTQNRE